MDFFLLLERKQIIHLIPQTSQIETHFKLKNPQSHFKLSWGFFYL